MSLLRSFTTRRNKPETIAADASIGRAASQRNGKHVNRYQISSPLALVSTTNMLSYNAPSINGTSPIGHRNISSTTTVSSAASSEGEHSDSTMSMDSDTDASSIDEASPGPEPNHLSCYFKSSVDASSTTSSTRPSLDAPAIPKRVPSHSKKAHESVHRKRSVQRMMSPPASIVRKSTEMFSPVRIVEEEHNPFSHELAKLDEAVEDMSITMSDVEKEDDITCMTSLDLAQFAASDYLAEIHGLTATTADQPSWF